MEFQLKYQGHEATMYAPHKDEILKHWRRGRFYEAMPRQLLAQIADLDIRVYVDVGAHWGNHAAFMANTATELHLIEPRPDSFEVLKKNLAPWKDKCSFYNVGCGGQSIYAKWEQEHENNVGSTKLKLSGRGPIKVVQLDELKLPKPDFIKIDVEGLELGVLFGGMDTITKYKPWVSCEVSDNRWDIDKFMTDLGYEVIETKNATPTHLYMPPK
jgi:FkbM family methyltransferase